MSLAPFAAVAANVPVPYRAVYDVVLASAKTGSSIASVEGEMLFQWTESCEGWTLDHRLLFDITYAPGATVRLTSTVATWESRDGGDYHFNVRNAANGELTEHFEGHARRSAEGGTVRYVAPPREPAPLPPGAVFPVLHTARVLAAAEDAPTLLQLIVFDGLSEEGAFRVSAVIGRPVAVDGDLPGDVARTMSGHRAWPVHLAYFRLAGVRAEPKHEIGMRMYDNGVNDRIVFDFGDFTVRADLLRIELDAKPSCGT